MQMPRSICGAAAGLPIHGGTRKHGTAQKGFDMNIPTDLVELSPLNEQSILSLAYRRKALALHSVNPSFIITRFFVRLPRLCSPSLALEHI
jgi:hypothetical protein